MEGIKKVPLYPFLGFKSSLRGREVRIKKGNFPIIFVVPLRLRKDYFLRFLGPEKSYLTSVNTPTHTREHAN